MSEGVRIQKVLADAGVASRRRADDLVAAGRVTVNGSSAVVGQRVDPDMDRVEVDGRPVGPRRRPVYLVLAKPAGVTSTVSDRHATRTVVELVPPGLVPADERIYPVGRLDRESEGLILLTNDGDWAQRLIHPRHAVEREYAVGLGRPLEAEQAQTLQRGVDLDEGLARVRSLRRATAAEVRTLEAAVRPPDRQLTWYRVVLTQGWKRQLRRMYAAVGSPVERLVRVRIGTLRLGGLRTGEVRPLTASERASLDALAGERGLIVSLDGPASSGKSTVGAAAAVELGYRFCDTGVLYRGLTWLALERGVEPTDGTALARLVDALHLAPDDEGRLNHLQVGSDDVTARLHTVDVERLVSTVARQAEVRATLLPVQRSLASGGRIIMAGRDIGTVILPDADLKLFIEVSLEERARRRVAERGLDPDGREAAELVAELRRRDGIDTSRDVAPLRVPDDAVVIRSDGNTLDQTVAAVVDTIRARERTRRG